MSLVFCAEKDGTAITEMGKLGGRGQGQVWIVEEFRFTERRYSL